MCPVRAPVARRSPATIANDDGPGGLSASTTPTGLGARGGIPASRGGRHVGGSDEVGDLRERLVAREAGGLAVTAAAAAARDRGDVDRCAEERSDTFRSGPVGSSGSRINATTCGPFGLAQHIDDRRRHTTPPPRAALKSPASRCETSSRPSASSCARSSARPSSFSFANCVVSYTCLKTTLISAPASSSRAAKRCAFAVVFEY